MRNFSKSNLKTNKKLVHILKLKWTMRFYKHQEIYAMLTAIRSEDETWWEKKRSSLVKVDWKLLQNLLISKNAFIKFMRKLWKLRWSSILLIIGAEQWGVNRLNAKQTIILNWMIAPLITKSLNFRIQWSQPIVHASIESFMQDFCNERLNVFICMRLGILNNTMGEFHTEVF